LGYIALSRSVYDTDIIYIENDFFERQEILFLKGIIEIIGKWLMGQVQAPTERMKLGA